MNDYDAWFKNLTGNQPHGWQRTLATGAACTDRLIRIPTGFGKTAGTVLMRSHHRVPLNLHEST